MYFHECTCLDVRRAIGRYDHQNDIMCTNDIFGVRFNLFTQDQQEFLILEIFHSGLMNHYVSVMVGLCF